VSSKVISIRAFNIYKRSLILNKILSNTTMRSIIYTFDTHDFNLEAILQATLFNILNCFVSFVFCTDSKSLYDCLIRLDTIQKKRLMIDVMSLRQLYERRKITKIKWRHDINNSIDFMIKNKTFTILKTLIDFNTINMNINEWIKRSNKIND
jgi:hypothetical protein